MRHAARIERIEARAYTVPTEAPEADGTFAWDATTLVVVEIAAGGETGLGYSYGAAATVPVIHHQLAPAVGDADAFAIPLAWERMVAATRNIGRPGVAATALAAVDAALWDLKARLLGISLVALLGRARDAVPIYGSGGFTSDSAGRLCRQLAGWVAELGCRAVKMKVGLGLEEDRARVRAARAAIGTAGLMVDANGAYDAKPALAAADFFAEAEVSWFEEPVSSDDLAGLRLLRERAPAGMEIAAGEYAYTPAYVRRMLAAGAVDVIQLDATRLCGITGFLRAAAIADAHGVPVSAHTAPALHLAVCCAAPRLRHVEWFHDHARIEALLFDGAPHPAGGLIRPDPARPGNGLTFKRADAERFAA